MHNMFVYFIQGNAHYNNIIITILCYVRRGSITVDRKSPQGEIKRT